MAHLLSRTQLAEHEAAFKLFHNRIISFLVLQIEVLQISFKIGIVSPSRDLHVAFIRFGYPFVSDHIMIYIYLSS